MIFLEIRTSKITKKYNIVDRGDEKYCKVKNGTLLTWNNRKMLEISHFVRWSFLVWKGEIWINFWDICTSIARKVLKSTNLWNFLLKKY